MNNIKPEVDPEFYLSDDLADHMKTPTQSWLAWALERADTFGLVNEVARAFYVARGNGQCHQLAAQAALWDWDLVG